MVDAIIPNQPQQDNSDISNDDAAGWWMGLQQLAQLGCSSAREPCFFPDAPSSR